MYLTLLSCCPWPCGHYKTKQNEFNTLVNCIPIQELENFTKLECVIKYTKHGQLSWFWSALAQVLTFGSKESHRARRAQGSPLAAGDVSPGQGPRREKSLQHSLTSLPLSSHWANQSSVFQDRKNGRCPFHQRWQQGLCWSGTRWTKPEFTVFHSSTICNPDYEDLGNKTIPDQNHRLKWVLHEVSHV